MRSLVYRPTLCLIPPPRRQIRSVHRHKEANFATLDPAMRTRQITQEEHTRHGGDDAPTSGNQICSSNLQKTIAG
jgi:hypothetical protein